MGYRAKVDTNQADIVSDLRKMGISVAVSHDDILCGWRNRTFWFEIKDPAKCFLADGVTYKKGAIKKSQSKLRAKWQGHYSVVTSTDEILYEMGIT